MKNLFIIRHPRNNRSASTDVGMIVAVHQPGISPESYIKIGIGQKVSCFGLLGAWVVCCFFQVYHFFDYGCFITIPKSLSS